MKVLIIGNGGREHAFAWKMSQSQQVSHVFVAPGNAGTAGEPKTENIAISATDIPALIDFAKTQQIDLTVVGPEAPLALGIVDQFQANQLNCFGPVQHAAKLESSKAYSKAFMVENNIPTAAYQNFTDSNEALKYIEHCDYPVVIKADGLAAGKGVVIAESKQHAEQVISDMLSGDAFGEAGKSIVIEQFLRGVEASFIAICDGERAIALASSQDHKARDDGDNGPNTGGMGAYSPAPIVTEQLHQQIMSSVIEPTLNALKRQGTPFTGFLYAGLMIDDNNQFNVLEFNCRFGDPETQAILFRLDSDFAELCYKACQQQLSRVSLSWDPQPALCVVLAAQGYPEAYQKGDEIHGLFDDRSNAKIFHAGTKLDHEKVVTNGGRVLAVTTKAENLANAKQSAYQLINPITWHHGVHYRHDIGDKAIGS